MKKTDLYNFISRKAQLRRNEELEKVKNFWTNDVEPVLKLGVRKALMAHNIEIRQTSRELYADLVRLNDLMPSFISQNWSLRNLYTELSGTSMDLSAEGIFKHYSDILGRRTRGGSDLSEELENTLGKRYGKSVNDLIKKYSKMYRDCDTVLEQLNTLENEANLVVKNSRNGKDGHKNLIALEFPLDGLEKSVESLLPSLQKFSVDTSILKSVAK